MKTSIYDSIGLKRVINASGRMTVLGVSTQSDGVVKSMTQAAQSFVWMEDLYLKAGEIISSYTGGEASVVTSCASSGIVLSVAGVIARDTLADIRRLPDSTGLKNEIILPKGHVIQFGAPVTSMIRIGGGVPVEAGLANEVTQRDIEEAINEKTAALMYIKSHHSVQKGMLSIESMVTIAKKHDIPLIIDAAAEEDLTAYINLGADLVVYSGSKAFEGPTSGFVTGKKDLIGYAYAQYKGVGRPMKVGKEGIVGLLKALEEYATKDVAASVEANIEAVNTLCDALNAMDGLSARMIQDEAGREIYRAELRTDDKLKASWLEAQLIDGNPAIYCRSYRSNDGVLYLDTRSFVAGDIESVIERIKELMEG